MSRKLYHPLWAHLPAAAMLLGMIGALAAAIPLPENMPIHFDWHGQLDGWGSAWEVGLAFPSLAVFYIGLSALLDELWARTEHRKRFNWLSLFDEIIVGLLTGTLLSVISSAQKPSVFSQMQWGSIATLTVGATLAAVVLELMRPHVPHEEPTGPEDTRELERGITKAAEEGESWNYLDIQNPIWINWAMALTFAVLVTGAVVTFFAYPWISLVIVFFAVLALFPFGGLRTSVNAESVQVRLGAIGIPILTLKIQNIESVDIHEFSPLADFGGYGIRFNTEMKAYYFSGNRGVKLTTVQGKQYLIGSDRPESLAAVISTARRTLRP